MTTHTLHSVTTRIGTEIELPEGVEILNAVPHNQGIKIIYLAPAEETYECGVNGCSREVDSEDETCWQHQGDKE